MPSDRPNIVVMISHDLGRHIGPYGHAQERSRNLISFAGESMRLDRHFVTSPGCSQSRASLITGRYPHSNGQFGLAHLGWELHRDELPLPALLRQHGYHTAMFGIWHLHHWTLKSFDTLDKDVSTRDSSPEGFAEIASAHAAEFLRKHAGRSEPFYLHVGFWETHRPFCGHLPPEECTADLDTGGMQVPPYLPDTLESRREFAELERSVSMVDRGVGRILDALDDHRFTRDTLVIFTADHGLPFPRAKGTLYDPGIEVAFLARWPEVIPAGMNTAELTSNVDVTPTLLEAAGVEIPARVQGRSFLKLLENGALAGRDAIFAEKTYHEFYDPIRCIRTARYKYIRNFAERPMLVMPSDVYNSPTRKSMFADEKLWAHRPAEELYDLEADPHEQVNLFYSPQHEHIHTELRRRLEQWMIDTDDPLRHGPIPRVTPVVDG